MKKYVILTTIVTSLAVLFAQQLASLFWTYQPKTPNALK